jgi:hypothetical protein
MGFLMILLGLTQIGIGCWEAEVANKNSNDLHGNNTQVYAYVICKACINIILGLCSVIEGFILTIYNNDTINTNNTNTNNKKKTSSNSFQCISLGVSIWGLVLYYNISNINNSLKNVLFVEMIIFYSALGLVGIVMVFSCLCCFCIESGTLPNIKNNKNINNDITTASTNTYSDKV